MNVEFERSEPQRMRVLEAELLRLQAQEHFREEIITLIRRERQCGRAFAEQLLEYDLRAGRPA